MRLELTGRHVEITPALRRLVDRKLARLGRLMNDSMVSAQVVLTREKYRDHVDVTLHARGEKFLHAVGDTGDWEASLGEAMEKVSRQALKVKGKWQQRKRRAVPPRVLGMEEPPAGRRTPSPRMVRATRYPVRAMTVDIAALEVADGPNAFLVFRNAETDSINVLYRRRDGDLALIDPDA